MSGASHVRWGHNETGEKSRALVEGVRASASSIVSGTVCRRVANAAQNMARAGANHANSIRTSLRVT